MITNSGRGDKSFFLKFSFLALPFLPLLSILPNPPSHFFALFPPSLFFLAPSVSFVFSKQRNPYNPNAALTIATILTATTRPYRHSREKLEEKFPKLAKFSFCFRVFGV